MPQLAGILNIFSCAVHTVGNPHDIGQNHALYNGLVPAHTQDGTADIPLLRRFSVFWVLLLSHSLLA